MPKSRFNFPVRGNLIDNHFIRPGDTQAGANGEWVSRCPGDFSDELGKFQYSYSATDLAVTAARRSYPSWRKLAGGERAELIKKFQSALQRREEEIVETLAREVGKSVWDAREEFAATVALIDASLGDGLKLVADVEIPGLMEGTRGSFRHRPHGVMAVVGPFSLPLQATTCQIVPALLVGNTVILKPSEKAPMVGQLLAELFQETGFPPGVFSLIQGEREVGRRLCVHEGIDGILFTGSYETGMRIKQDTLQQHWKLLALEMGGKNSTILWQDTDFDRALYDTLVAAFMTAGQRCNSTSRIIIHESLRDRFVDQFHARAKAFAIGHPLDNPFMGPLIEQGAVDRYMKFVGIASREGCEVIMRGKSLELATPGNYVTPSVCLVENPSIEASRKSVFQQTELLGPSVAILGVKDIEEAIAQANVTQFGLVTSVYTHDRAVFEKCWDGLQTGVIHWNKSTVSYSPRLPFGGLKKSGNHFPSGILASRYCAYPVSSLEMPETKALVPAHPGINWGL